MKQIALVTGAGRGIGKEIAKKLQEDGYFVIANSKNTVIENTETQMGYLADVSNSSEVSKMIEDITKKYGKIDVLVNNAGIAQQKLFTDITEADWDTMMDTNLKSMFLVTKAVLPHMIHKKCGAILNISSIWGMVGASCEVHYSAAKAGVIGFTKALAKEVAPCNIRVNCVAPGIIKTDMLNDFTEDDLADLAEETPLGTLGTPRDIAEAVSFLVSDKAKFITGQMLSSNGGFVI
ncbi:MAG: glucose 1-dehydrogenase [Ruminococcaceae bacterium]|nr:glucose 1-dehydrogenase [Oscillospiraceae bacterium]